MKSVSEGSAGSRSGSAHPGEPQASFVPPPASGPAVEPRSPVSVHLALLMVSLLFGGNYVVAKFAFREITPFTLVVLRMCGTAAILLLVSAFLQRGKPRDPLTRREYGELFVLSMLGTTINQICFLEGLARSTATNAALILVAIPVITLAFAVLLGREKLTPSGTVGIVLGLVGALVLVLPRGGVSLSAETTIGNILLLTGGICFSLYLVLTRPILARHDPLRVMSWIFLFSGLTVLPFGVAGLGELGATGLSTSGWLSLGYVVVGSTVLPYMLNSWALVRVKSSIVAVYILLQPLVAGTLGHIFLDERIGPNSVIAAVLVISGVVISGRRRM